MGHAAGYVFPNSEKEPVAVLWLTSTQLQYESKEHLGTSEGSSRMVGHVQEVL